MMGFTGPDDVADERDDVEPVSGLVAAVRRDLEKADRLDTFTGQLALQLAKKIATQEATGIASLSKELRVTLALALMQPADDDPESRVGDELDVLTRTGSGTTRESHG